MARATNSFPVPFSPRTRTVVSTLHERLDDLEGLVTFFIKKFAKAHGRSFKGLNEDALKAMKNYRWPGNIRELENVIERAFIVENGDRITLNSLPEQIKAAKEQVALSLNKGYSGPLDFEAFKEQAEKDFIISALKATGGKINKTVAEANIPKNTLLRKIRKYGINVRDYSKD